MNGFRYIPPVEVRGHCLGDPLAVASRSGQPSAESRLPHRRTRAGVQDPAAAAAATHHLLLGHGMAVKALRGLTPTAAIGITLDMHPVQVLDGLQLDSLEQARLVTDADLNGLFLEPLLRGSYPARAGSALLPPASLIAAGDMETISQPPDFLGVNYYAPVYLRAGNPADLRKNEEPARCRVPGVVEYRPDWLDRTPMGWLVDPDALYDLLLRLSKDAPVHHREWLRRRGLRKPPGRGQRLRARYIPPQAPGSRCPRHRGWANLAGYFVWSLLDNFEWAWGYQKRFGIVFVDFGTQRRIPKSSAKFYSDVVRANAVPISAG